jgi:hypothetical protein
MTREEMMNEIARLRSLVYDLDAAQRDDKVNALIKRLTDWGFTQDIDGYFRLTVDNNVQYICNLDSCNMWIIDLMNDETIFDDDYLTAVDMLESLDQIPDIYWVEQTVAKIKYDDGDLDNCKIIKTYKLGS